MTAQRRQPNSTPANRRTDPVERLLRRAHSAGMSFEAYVAAQHSWDHDVERLSQELQARPARADRPWWRSPTADLLLRRLAGEVSDEAFFTALDGEGES